MEFEWRTEYKEENKNLTLFNKSEYIRKRIKMRNSML